VNYPYSFIPARQNAPKTTERERVLALWRGWEWVGAEKERKNPAKTMAQVMPGVLSRMRLDQRQSEAEVAKVWDSLIDPAITAHARPAGVHKGTLFVSVDSSVWLDEIVRYRRKEILERLQTSFGPTLITKISFRVG